MPWLNLAAMVKKVLSVVQYIFFLSLGLGLLWYSFSNMSDKELEDLKTAFLQTNFWLLLPVSFTLIVAHFSRGMRWKILMKPMGYRPTNANVFFSVMLGYFFNLLVPRLGEIMKCTALAKYEKIPPDKLIGTIVAERAFDVVCLLLIMVITVLVQFDVIGQYTLDLFSQIFQNKAGDINYLKILLILVIIVVLILILRRIFKKYGHKGFIGKLRTFFKGILEGLTSLSKVKQRGWFIFHTALIWTMYLLSIYMGFYAFPAIEHLGIKGSLTILVFGSIGMIIPTPGGVGSYQYALQKTLPLYGVSEVIAFAFGNVLWAAQTLILIAGGIVSLIVLPFINRKK